MGRSLHFTYARGEAERNAQGASVDVATDTSEPAIGIGSVIGVVGLFGPSGMCFVVGIALGENTKSTQYRVFVWKLVAARGTATYIGALAKTK